MADSHTAVGHILADKLGYFRQTCDAVVDKKHLSVAAHLKVYSIGYYLVAIGAQLGVDGITVGRWRAHDAHVARSHQRELQCTRYWRGRHGKRVDVCLHFPELLLG